MTSFVWVYDHTGLDSVGKTGDLFPSGNVEALAEKLLHFNDLPDAKILEMGKIGREWAIQNFSASRYRERLIDLYSSMGIAV